MISGRAIAAWLEDLNRDSSCSLAAQQSYVLSYERRDYFFVIGTVSYVTFGRFGPLLGRSTFHGLIAIGPEAVHALSANPRLFRRLNGTDQLAAFTIRRLARFVDSLTGASQAGCR